MLKKLFISFLALFVLLFPTKVSAEGEFLADLEVLYEVGETGETRVVNTITLENATSDLYATSYALNLQSIDPKGPRAFEGEKELTLVSEKKDDTVILKVFFDNAVVGMGGGKILYH